LTFFFFTPKRGTSSSRRKEEKKSEAMEKAKHAPPTFAEKVSTAVWEILKPELPTHSPLLKAPPLLDVDKEKLRSCANPEDFSNLVELHIRRSYSDEGATLGRHLRLRLETIAKKVDEVLGEEPDVRASREKLMLFKPFVGDADARFLRHLRRCCKLYLADPSVYAAPWLVLTQSSGFGKTRLLHQVATKLANGTVDERPEGDALDVRLLYLSTRGMEHSSPFMPRTPDLVQFFFREGRVAHQLACAVEYACGKWEAVKRDWLGLFGVDFIDESEAEYTLRCGVPSEQQRWHDIVAEATLHGALRNTRAAYSGSLPIPEDENARVKVLVLAIDKASHVREREDNRGRNYLQLLGSALTELNSALRDRNVLVFAVLVDTNPQIADWGPSGSKRRSFPPFVLTHTMDVMLSRPRSAEAAPFDYKTSVLEDDKAWDVLVSMGRPLWRNYHTSAMNGAASLAIYTAARMLLGGLDPTDVGSYTEGPSVKGVASMLCRPGLRPQSSSVFASQAVADLMAVLHYVGDTRDVCVCGYVTEPVLALGATHLWYGVEQALEKFVLPQLRELLMRGVLEVDNVGDVVARIVLLLAMDEASSMDGLEFGLFQDRDLFRGQFGSVKRLMGVLDGSQKDLDEDMEEEAEQEDKDGLELLNVVGGGDATAAQRASFEAWVNDWDKWSVGFSQFVELTDVPTEATLWFLLGRRAAGVLPREQEGADLIIPIFCKTTAEASCILVQVSGEDDGDAGSVQSALGRLTPASVFEGDGETKGKHELGHLSPLKMVRILMSLRESKNVLQPMPAQSYLLDRDEATDTETYALRLRGVCGSPAQGSNAPVEKWPFLQSEKVSELLAEIAASAYWDPTEVIKADLTSTTEEMPREELEEAVGFTLQAVPCELESC